MPKKSKFKKNKKISIIVPVFNEEGNIKLLVNRLNTCLKKKEIIYELIFIDDFSTDNTAKIIKDLSKTHPIHLFKKQGKQGKAYSLLQGFEYTRYELLAILDGDLQYPPEAIPEMINKLDLGLDIVVANRKEQKINFIRKFTHKGFMYFFGKLLHGLDVDVQSGLKVFKKEILKRINIKPTAWTFDLEFLIKAQHAGYKIGGVDIVFENRQNGKSKLPLFKSIFEIGFSAIKTKFSSPKSYSFLPEEIRKTGIGFHYNGKKYFTYSDLDHNDSALFRINLKQTVFILITFSFVLAAFLINWHFSLVFLVAAITVFYFMDLLFNFFLIFRSFRNKPEIKIPTDEIKDHKKGWPKYTILCPLYKEWKVLPQFVSGINRLDYPKNKIQVLLLLEEDDQETIRKVQELSLPKNYEVQIVPHSYPKTKPKACNYGLNTAKGEYVVIYDAEDIPEEDQLKKVVLAFEKSNPNVVCIQAKLNFYNPHQNLLTKLFTSEYSLWFDLILTGLQSINAPIPLGGTSNHFKTQTLKILKGWDAFNVTEDCDLGIRIAKLGFKTAVVDSTTYEEANSDLPNWFLQRTRWIKGYMQTYLVHMRSPYQFIKKGGFAKFIVFQFVVGTKLLSVLVNPFMWLITILYFTFRATFGSVIESFYPTPILYLGVFSLLFGNFLYFYYYMIGCAKRNYNNLIKYAFFVPFYWLLMSFAAWESFRRLIVQPHYWSKTNHGLHLNEKQIAKELTGLAKKPALTRPHPSFSV